jgi:hypothetical protein
MTLMNAGVSTEGWKEVAGEIGVRKGGDCEHDCILGCTPYHEQTLKVSEGGRGLPLSQSTPVVRATERTDICLQP